MLALLSERINNADALARAGADAGISTGAKVLLVEDTHVVSRPLVPPRPMWWLRVALYVSKAVFRRIISDDELLGDYGSTIFLPSLANSPALRAGVWAVASSVAYCCYGAISRHVIHKDGTPEGGV